MQSETADFAPGAANWQTGRNVRVVSDSDHSLYYFISLPSKEDRSTATGNMYRKTGEIWTVVFEICEQIDK